MNVALNTTNKTVNKCKNSVNIIDKKTDIWENITKRKYKKCSDIIRKFLVDRK